MTLVLPQHLLTLVCDRPAMRVTGMIGSSVTPGIEGGVGGFASFTRPRRSAMIEWSGAEIETTQLVLRLMPEASGDVDAALRVLQRMARMQGEGVAPPVIRVEGLVPAAGRRWAITGLVESDMVRSPSGAYERCIVTVDLMAAENTSDGVVVAKRAPAKHKVRKGETITSIAVRVYGSAKHAKALAQAQKPVVRDIRAKLKPGRMLRLP